MRSVFYVILATCILVISCSKKTAPVSGEQKSATIQAIPSAPCIIYKTKKDYAKYVPVALSDDKSHISSFPGVLDLKRNNQYTYPTQLIDGYLLDNRGIGPDVAFLKITYEEYYNYDQVPLATDLFGRILETDPLLEMYRCGNMGDYIDPVRQLNEKIRSGKLGDCIRLK